MEFVVSLNGKLLTMEDHMREIKRSQGARRGRARQRNKRHTRVAI